MAAPLPHPAWPRWQRAIFRLGFLWLSLLMLTFPVPHDWLPSPGIWLRPVTTAFADLAAPLFGLRGPYLHELASDNALLYVHVLLMLQLALLGAALWGWLDRDRRAYPRLAYGLGLAARLFVAAAMLSYGFAKVFKTQFYLPDPNTLYTPLGQVSRDLLYWSTMGVSRGYNQFTGWAEVVVGLLLLWRRTQLLGALLGLSVLSVVVAVNLSFDISVKLYGMLLFVLCFAVLLPDLPRLWALFTGRGVPPAHTWGPTFASARRRFGWGAARGFVAAALLWNAIGNQVLAGQFDDDTAPRPPFHGAYAVTRHTVEGQDLPPDLRYPQRWRRLFIHRSGYAIVQTMDDVFWDYAYLLDTRNLMLIVTDQRKGETYYWHYDAEGDALTALRGVAAEPGKSGSVELKQLDWEALPLLRGDFHWTSDNL